MNMKLLFQYLIGPFSGQTTTVKVLTWVIRILTLPLWLFAVLVIGEAFSQGDRQRAFNRVSKNKCRTCGTVNHKRGSAYVGASLITGEYIQDSRCSHCGGRLFVEDAR